ncbi:MAG: MoaD/ThiS family protein [Candidatus Bathyarchaeia archaeon]
MRIRVKFVGDLRQKVGMADLWMRLPEGATVEKLLEDLRKTGIKVESENPSMVIFVNGRRLEFIGGLKAELKDLDELTIMPIIAGGA